MTSEDEKLDIDDVFDNPFKEESAVTDLALIVEGKKVFVNKALVGIASPVFNAMFESDFKEKHCSEVELPGKSFEDVVEFLRVIYPNIYTPLDFKTVMRVLPLMHEYDCQCQMKEFHKFLIQNINPDKKDVDIDILLQCMYFADICGMEDVMNNCIEQGAKYSSSVLAESDLFDKAPVHVKEKLYYKRMTLLEKTGKDLVTDIIRNCSACKDRITHKKLGLLLDTVIQTTSSNWCKYVFEVKSTSKDEIEIKNKLF